MEPAWRPSWPRFGTPLTKFIDAWRQFPRPNAFRRREREVTGWPDERRRVPVLIEPV